MYLEESVGCKGLGCEGRRAFVAKQDVLGLGSSDSHKTFVPMHGQPWRDPIVKIFRCQIPILRYPSCAQILFRKFCEHTSIILASQETVSQRIGGFEKTLEYAC